MLTGAEVEATVAEALAPLLGERDADGESIFPRPPGARSTRSSSAAPTTRCCGRSSRPLVGERVAIVDSATATASALAELLIVNGLEAPGTTRGTAADAGMAGHERPDEAPTRSSDGCTTGDVGRASATSPSGCSAPAFPDVEAVELGIRAWPTR